MGKKSSFSTLKRQIGNLTEGALTIPNLLSVLRILVIPVFVWLFLTGRHMVAVIVLFISGMTDLFDGKIARKLNQISNLGKLLDPAADKLTQITVTLVYFISFHRSSDRALNLFSYVFLLFIFKELTMIVGSFVLLSMDIVPQPAIIYGKVATMAFYLVMGLLMLFAPEFGALTKYFTMPHALLMTLVIISAIMTFVALFSYLPDVMRSVKAKKEEKTI